MPLPKPTAGESHDNFMSRCMGDETMQSEYPDNDQRYAVCQTQWESKKSKTPFTLDLDFLMKEIAEEIGRVEREIIDRILRLESRQLEKGERGERGDPGKDGKSVTMEEILPFIKAHFSEWVLNWEKEARAILEKIVEKIPPPQKGGTLLICSSKIIPLRR